MVKIIFWTYLNKYIQFSDQSKNKYNIGGRSSAVWLPSFE